jgi:RNA binding exosome subunit
VTRRFSSMHARTFCHATEDLARVELAMRSVVGETVIRSSSTEGHFGNPIVVLESTVEDEDCILDLLRQVTEADRLRMSSTLMERIDEACQLFLRFDKQEAYSGRLKLASGDDVVAVRIKVRAFPAKRQVAADVVSEALAELPAAAAGRHGPSA